MIERLYIREYLSFDEVELEFGPGLVVFTGPSGAGKSILIDAILALFGYKNPQARLSEIDLSGSFDLERYGFESEEITTIKAIKKEKSRYFLNGQSVSKRLLQEIFSGYVSYLHQRDNTFFAPANILFLIDSLVEDPEFSKLKKRFVELFEERKELMERIGAIEEMERKNEELREFLEFEIAKIESVDPKPGEFEELMQIKKELSKKERLAEAIERAQQIFEFESAVSEALALMERESGFFDEAMNELRDIFYGELDRLQELEEVNIEEVLERIEALSALKRRYGSIEEALAALDQKRAELDRLRNIAFEKETLHERLKRLEEELEKVARQVSDRRKIAAKRFQDRINDYLPALKLPKVRIELMEQELDRSGIDRPVLELAGVPFDRISSGEYNRLRLAFMAASGGGSGVLILDEIDANISGEESMAVAKILKRLAKSYQIFAISHQAQLASLADHHFLVTKENGKSQARMLHGAERVEEIARIISGEKITDEARNFAQKLLKEAS